MPTHTWSKSERDERVAGAGIASRARFVAAGALCVALAGAAALTIGALGADVGNLGAPGPGAGQLLLALLVAVGMLVAVAMTLRAVLVHRPAHARTRAVLLEVRRSVSPRYAGAVGFALALGVIGGLQWLHAGAHESGEPSLLVHWLRDTALALPACLLALCAAAPVARALSARLGGRAGANGGSRVRSTLIWLAVGGAAFALAAMPGADVHARLFGADQHGHSALGHALYDGVAVFVVGTLVLLAITCVIGAPWDPTGARRRLTSLVSPGGIWTMVAAGGAVFAALAALPSPVPGIAPPLAGAAPTGSCERSVYAEVVALDQPFLYNRLGASNPNGMMYALKRDVVSKSGNGALEAGKVMLRPGKRPRPLVLRMNAGDCLTIEFTNLLDPEPVKVDLPATFPEGGGVGPNTQVDDQPVTRQASITVNGLHAVDSISDNGTFVGENTESGLVDPGETTTYHLHADPDSKGTYLLNNGGAVTGAEGLGGTTSFGLFGAVNVEPEGAEWYRSQVTRVEMDLATIGTTDPGTPDDASDDLPKIDYDAKYPGGEPFASADIAGLPILAMLAPKDGYAGEIVRADLNAVITGPDAGRFRSCGDKPEPDCFVTNKALGDRTRPFREFTTIFHDEIFAVQAFPKFYNDPVLSHTLHGVRDGFAINYGTGGIGSEILANRLGVGPMAACTDCKYEESFLAAWAVGDPAMVVDVPANADLNGDGEPDEGPKATKALFPDDPSNVHHSYMNDRVVFRNLHAGPKESHVFHLHAHQWVHREDEPNSSYQDSQHLGVGSAETYEIAYGGSGNRNKTVGDSIFHCHFYPHFAQGMWELWRTHDVFERGTELDAGGTPVAGARALPDGEIAAGTPIPGIVPLPTVAMAPMPDPDTKVVPQEINASHDGPDASQIDADGNGTADVDENFTAAPERNPGYPFFMPGETGHRPPTPPLDMAVMENGGVQDGGLPRHIIRGGTDEAVETRLDFNKELITAKAEFLPEEGTAAEKVAMKFHEGLRHKSAAPDGTLKNGGAGFETNGLPRKPGAPYADPCRKDAAPGDTTVGPIAQTRTYKTAVIQKDVTLNKVGWHFPQQRFQTLWADVEPTMQDKRAPQPLVMRLNSRDCAELWHTNLVPNVYELDDYQVKTPTDIIGQHIHLVKFDVTSSDGSANGWNYEDGTLSPDEVRERVRAIRKENKCTGDEYTGETREDGSCPIVKANPFFGEGEDHDGDGRGDWMGARTTIQRWYADPLLERSWDGGVGTVFTHDHYGPSTHQQVGLYSTVLVEPDKSKWQDPETGTIMGGEEADGTQVKSRSLGDGFGNDDGTQSPESTDGGPTNWQANILTEDPANSHREFFLEFSDFQHAYKAGGGALKTVTDPGSGHKIKSYADFVNAINPSFRQEPAADQLSSIYKFPPFCPKVNPGTEQVVADPSLPRPCPEAISADDPGTYVVNYRNEPLALRVFDPKSDGQAKGDAGDLSQAFSSNVKRAIPALNSQPTTYPPLTGGLQGGDPYTPLLRTYPGDKIRIRTQVGGQEEDHNFSIMGMKWRLDPFVPNSGWRDSQSMGISEYHIVQAPVLPDSQPQAVNPVDYLYTMGAQTEDIWNGIWGLMRSYGKAESDLVPLPNNEAGFSSANARINITNIDQVRPKSLCPIDAPLRDLRVTAVRAADVVPGGTLVYNSRDTALKKIDPVAGTVTGATVGQGPLHDPTALMYVRSDDLDPATGKLKPGVPVEPLVLRARAGECLSVTLTNRLPKTVPDLMGFNALPPIVHKSKRLGDGSIVTFNANDLTASSQVGLHAQLLSYDPQRAHGANIGINADQTLNSGRRGDDSQINYLWYAGHVDPIQAGGNGDVTLEWTPVEYGAINLTPSDVIKQSHKGLFGALVIEPQNATWDEDENSRASATVNVPGEEGFREFVAVLQNDVNLRYSNGGPVGSVGGEGGLVAEDPQDSGNAAVNYRSEPLWFRLGVDPASPFTLLRNLDVHDVFSNSRAGVGGDPQTPVFTASKVELDSGRKIRLRVLQPGGHARATTLAVGGHSWENEPYTDDSSKIGANPRSPVRGAQAGISAGSHFDLLLDGGPHGAVKGDYLFRDLGSFGTFQGAWGVLRITP